jgi:hypothetical protein
MNCESFILAPEGDRMRRREFIALIGSSAAACPFAARAGKLPTIGFLGSDVKQ